MSHTLKTKCPNCDGNIVYNGNYFCVGASTSRMRSDAGCGWVLPGDDGNMKRDDLLLYKQLVREEYERRGEEPPDTTQRWLES